MTARFLVVAVGRKDVTSLHLLTEQQWEELEDWDGDIWGYVAEKWEQIEHPEDWDTLMALCLQRREKISNMCGCQPY